MREKQGEKEDKGERDGRNKWLMIILMMFQYLREGGEAEDGKRV